MMILNGCGHSFHHECFPAGQNICCICKEELTSAIESLSEKAAEAILHPDKGRTSTEPSKEDENADSDDDDDDEGVEEDGTNGQRITSSIINSCLQLQQEIFSWGLIASP